MAIISLVTGLICIFVSIILGHLARSEIRKSKGSIVGQGIALSGLILGNTFSILIGILLLVGWLDAATVFLYTKMTKSVRNGICLFLQLRTRNLKTRSRQFSLHHYPAILLLALPRRVCSRRTLA